ncbi:MAG: hypothetical protein ACKOSS_07245, partial [Planctomycetia bacterium]
PGRRAALHAQGPGPKLAPTPARLPPSPTVALAGHVVEVDIGLPWALHGPWVRRRAPTLA